MKRIVLITALILGYFTPALVAQTEEHDGLPVVNVPSVSGPVWGGPRGGVLFDNGPIVTSPGTGSGGADESVLQNTSLGMTTLGIAANPALGDSRLSDDFVVDGNGWAVDSITLFGYQTGAPSSPSTIAAVSLNIWDGPPNDGASNMVATFAAAPFTSSFSDIFRVAENTLGANNRAVFATVVDVTTGGQPLQLTAGTYWIDIQLTGSASFSGPWMPPITITGQTTTGNGLSRFMGAWNPWLDGGTSTPQGMPFIIEGNPLCMISDMVLNGDQLTITGNCPSGLDVYCDGANGLQLVASGVVVNGTTTITVPFHPDAFYHAALPGTTDVLNGVTTDRTVPTLGTWGLIAFLALLTGAGVVYTRKTRLARA